eukprot:16510-Heterococcus_DN1.PRE.1
MKHIFIHRSDMQVWHKAVNGEQVDWAEFFAGWEACVDAPASCVWRELLEAFPDALLLHSVLDADRWYDSTLETLYTNLPGFFPKYLQAVIPFTKQWTNMMEKFIWQGTFKGRFTDRDFAIS